MVAKLIDGVLKYPQNKVVISNPPEPLLKEYLGYKDYIEQGKPTYDPMTQKLVAQYSEDDDTITCSYSVVDIPEDEQQQDDTSKRLSKLENEVSGITSAIQEGIDI
jgi:hypothetical protein